VGIEDQVATIEDSIVTGDIVSVVRAFDGLRALLASGDGSSDAPVLRALCRWSNALGRHDEVASYAARLAAAPDARPFDRLWAQYWMAQAAPVDDDPAVAFHGVLGALDDDLSAEATELGIRVWIDLLGEGPAVPVLGRFVDWARPRFPSALPRERWMVVSRVHDGVLALGDQAVAIPVLQDLVAWPGLEVELRRMLRGRLASALRDHGDPDAARAEYLILAAEAAEEPPALELELSSRVQAARLGARSSESASVAIAELEEALRGAHPTTEGEHESVALVRLTRVELLLAHRPIEGVRAALDLWTELGSGPSDELARLAGLALARSWAEADAPTRLSRSTQIIDRFPSVDDPEVRTLVVMALNSRTRAYAESGDAAQAAADAEHAVALAELGVPDFVRDTAQHNREALRLRGGDYSERDEIYGVARRLGDDADTASARGDRAESARMYERTFEMTRLSDDPKTRLVGLAALRGWTFDLVADGDHARAAEVARRSIESSIPDDQVGSELLAQAWLHFGISTNRLADRVSALHAFAQAAAVTGDRADASVREIHAQAIWNTAVLLDDGNRPSDALQAYRSVIDRLSTSSSMTDQRRVAKALKNSAVILRDEVNRPHESVDAWAQIVARFDGNPDAELTRLVEEARAYARPVKRRGLWGRKG
jgi:hypothetical protein